MAEQISGRTKGLQDAVLVVGAVELGPHCSQVPRARSRALANWSSEVRRQPLKFPQQAMVRSKTQSRLSFVLEIGYLVELLARFTTRP